MSGFEEHLLPSTRCDLRFRIGNIPVRVNPSFWLPILILGLARMDQPLADCVMHMAAEGLVLFVSILIHELGHVLAGRYFGSSGHILLTGFCGLAIGSTNLPGRWQRIAVCLAGPGAGFLLAGLVTGLFWLYNPDFTLSLLGEVGNVDIPVGAEADLLPEIVEDTAFLLLWLNIFWGLVNLLPIWPLDGGQISRELCQASRGRGGLRLSLQISLLTAAGFAVFGLLQVLPPQPLIPYFSLERMFPAVVFFGAFAFLSWQQLRVAHLSSSFRHDEDDQPHQAWERDPDWRKRGDSERLA
jgi:Zn-dependent protease